MSSLSRDAIQGFIDGLKAEGSDLSDLNAKLTDWMQNHPLYPQDSDTIGKILSDMGSYRI